MSNFSFIEDGTTEKAHTFEADQSVAAIKVISNGQLNQQGETAQTYRVGMRTKDHDYFVGVISKEFYGQLAQIYTETMKPEGYPIVAVGYYKQYTPIPFIGVAHAGFWDWSFDDAFDAMKTAINVMLPIEDTMNFIKQINYLIDDDKRFDPLELTLSSLGVISVIPVLKPVLLPLKNALKVFLKPLNASNPKFIKSIGGVIGKIGEDVINGKYDTAVNIGYFMLITGQMLADEESRKGLMVMIKSITSADDMFVWAEYLGLPANGWADGEEKNIDLASTLKQSPYPWENNFFFNTAYAKGPNAGELVDVVRLTKLFSKVTKGFAKKGGDIDGEKLVSSVKSVTQGMKKSDNEGLRKLLHNPLPLFSAKAVGDALNRKFLETTRNLRMSPLSLMAIVTFLEIHKQDDCSDVYPECKPFPDQIKGELGKLYVESFASSLNDNTAWVGGREIGGAFHLAMLAVKQLSYELYGVESEKPIAMEVSRPIKLVNINKKDEAVDSGLSYKRRVDIVLKGDASNDLDYRSDKNIWVEIKSLKYKANYLDSWKQWNLKGKKYSYHRQFYLDRVASTENKLDGAKELILRRAEDFEWWLQDFKRASRHAYSASEMSKVRTRLRYLPSSNKKAAYASLGYDDPADNNTQFPKSKVNSRFKHQNIKNWVLGDAKAFLLDGVDEESINELIND